MILLISGIVLIVVFISTLVFGVLRIVNDMPQGTITTTNYDSSSVVQPTSGTLVKTSSNKYALAEDMAKLIIELIFILFAILGTFVLHRYVKDKYAAVPTTEPKPK